jgi:hypothetical protein
MGSLVEFAKREPTAWVGWIGWGWLGKCSCFELGLNYDSYYKTSLLPGSKGKSLLVCEKARIATKPELANFW